MVNKVVMLMLLLGVCLAYKHVLTSLSPHLKRLSDSYKEGDTSDAFSHAMQLFFKAQIINESNNIELEENMDVSEEMMGMMGILKTRSCDDILQEVHSLVAREDWMKHMGSIYKKLQLLHSKCTNSDFKYGKNAKGANGFDDNCALCTVITRVMENYVMYHRRDVTKFIQDQFCSLFDGMVKPTCEAFTHYWGGLIIKAFLNKQNSDVICAKMKLCKNPQCKIVQPAKKMLSTGQEHEHEHVNDILDEILMRATSNKVSSPPSLESGLNKPAPWQWLIKLFTDHFGDKHLPPFDLDNDTFSDISTFRGYHWRGADCNEVNHLIYPGRKTKGKKDDTDTDINIDNHDDQVGMRIAGADHDCNGIWGLDSKGKQYEQSLCSGYKRYGVVVIGDSAGAHFSIPQKFFNVSMMHKGTFKNFLPTLADELDIPHESAYTGHTNTTYNSHSVYKYLRQHNLCNNNDYQNLGVNGGDSGINCNILGNSWGNIKALKRDPVNDYPLLMFMELIGNDVCAKSFDGMTKPAEFKKNVLKLWEWLDTTVPKGSHLFVLGLADGDLLYQYLHDSIHPLNVTYETVYNFLNCLKISPCWGWLNTDSATRKKTTEHARLLSAVYKQILDEGHTFKNFDVVYYDFPTQEIIKRKMMQGGSPTQMIQRCDGFHPSIEFNSFLADWFWYKIKEHNPQWLGEQNKNNQEIKRIFGLKDLK